MSDSAKRDDWRWQGTILATSAHTEGRVLPAGEIVRSMIPVDAFGRDVNIPAPNVSACLLDLSISLWAEASQSKHTMAIETNGLHTTPSPSMDFYGKTMASIILAYASLESFIILLIPHNAKWTKPKHRGIFSVLFKPTLERQSTEVKLGDALPAILRFESPKGKREWERFLILKDHRDRIVHCKTADQIPKVTANHLWQIWIANDCPCYPAIAWELINYTALRIERAPLWVKQFQTTRRFDTLTELNEGVAYV